MNIPVFTKQQLKKWDNLFIEGDYASKKEESTALFKAIPGFNKLFSHATPEQFRESYYCGSWMGDYLEEKFPDRIEDIQKACFAFGQRAAHTREEDMKKLAVRCITDFENGVEILKPEVLAVELLREHMKVLL